MNAEFYLKQLFSMPADRQFTIKNDDGWLVCINPEHSGGFESTPSAKITLDEGSPYLGRYFCFGCSCKMSWNEFATKMKLDKIDEDYKGVRVRKLGFKQGAAKAATEVVKKTFSWPETKEWRGVPGTIVKQLGGYVYANRDVLQEQMLILPVMMYGEEVGIVRALMRDPKRNKKGKKLEESYINSKGSWAQHALFGFDIAFKKKGPLWLIEGPRDECKGLMADVRSAALLGSKFGEGRAELVRLLNPPCVIAATDNDDAGNAAAESILELCGDFVPVVRVSWKEGEDMFDQPLEKIQKIDAKYRKKYGVRR